MDVTSFAAMRFTCGTLSAATVKNRNAKQRNQSARCRIWLTCDFGSETINDGPASRTFATGSIRLACKTILKSRNDVTSHNVRCTRAQLNVNPLNGGYSGGHRMAYSQIDMRSPIGVACVGRRDEHIEHGAINIVIYGIFYRYSAHRSRACRPGMCSDNGR